MLFLSFFFQFCVFPGGGGVCSCYLWVCVACKSSVCASFGRVCKEEQGVEVGVGVSRI